MNVPVSYNGFFLPFSFRRSPMIPNFIARKPWSGHFFLRSCEKEQRNLRFITNGVYCPGHILGGEVKDSVFHAKGYFTHNPPDKSQAWWVDSKNVYNDPNCKQGPQWFVPFDENVYIPVSFLSPALKGTEYHLRENTPLLNAIKNAIKRVRGDSE